LSLDHIWLPYTQMKTTELPVPVLSARGVRLQLADGRELIDGIASWWTACHGYGHPYILKKIAEQLEKMPHGPERDCLAGLLANRRGQVAQSIELLNRALPALRETRDARASVALMTLADDYTKTFAYEAAAKLLEDAEGVFPDDEVTEELRFSDFRLKRMKYLLHLLRTDRMQVLPLIHEWEAYTVKENKVAKYWKPSPFPCEL